MLVKSRKSGNVESWATTNAAIQSWLRVPMILATIPSTLSTPAPFPLPLHLSIVSAPIYPNLYPLLTQCFSSSVCHRIVLALVNSLFLGEYRRWFSPLFLLSAFLLSLPFPAFSLLPAAGFHLTSIALGFHHQLRQAGKERATLHL